MPGLLSSPVFLTVIWFLLSWSLGPSHAQIWTDEVSDVQYGRLDSNVTLECGKSEIGIPVEWRHNHSSVLPWHKVTSDGRLVLYHVDQSAQGNYSCYDNNGLLRSISLRLGHPPGLLSISCQVPNHTHVRCSWRESVKTFLPAGFNASFRGKGQEWRPCIMDDFTHRHCDVHHPAFWQTIHMLRVIETNALGSETTLAQLRLHELLKPDPPESVSAKEVEGFPMKLNVTWHYPSSWPRGIAFPLLFHIRYKPHGSKVWSEIFREDDEVVISDALAGHLHQVQVRARDDVNPESQWSEWTQLQLVRPWEEDPNPDPEENTEPPDCYGFCIEPSTSTKPTHAVNGDEGNLGLVVLLVLFSVFILTTVLSLIFIVWMRQKRTEHATKQELASMVKMKSIPI